MDDWEQCELIQEELEMYKSVREEVKAVEIYKLRVYINIIFDTMKKLRLDNMCKKGINIYIQRQIILAHKKDLLRQDKPPQVTKILSKSVKELTNWLKNDTTTKNGFSVSFCILFLRLDHLSMYFSSFFRQNGAISWVGAILGNFCVLSLNLAQIAA